ncbi:MAG: beta/gamma crystallin domain-containing protein [Gammaproteobacteria bacterium]
MNRRKLKIAAILAASYAFVCTEVLATTHEDKENGGGGAATKIATTPRDRSASENQTDASTITVGVPVTAMVPLEFKVEPQAKGCWVELYTKKSFRGDRLTLVGPLDMARMRGPFGADWENEVESIRAGPKATVTIFDSQHFAKRSAIVLPHEEIGDLDNRMQVSDSFRSMRVACLPKR